MPAASSPKAAIFSCWITRRLRGPQGVGPFLDPLFQLGPDTHQLRVQPLQLVAGRLAASPASDELAHVTQTMIIRVSGQLDAGGRAEPRIEARRQTG